MIALAEAAVAGLLILTGSLVLNAAGLRRLDALLLAPLAGTGIFMALSLALAVSPMAFDPLKLLAATAAIGIIAFLVSIIMRWQRFAIADLAWTVMGPGVAGVAFWLLFPLLNQYTVITHSDSFRYMQIAGMLYHDTLQQGVGLGQLQARMLAMPALYSIANLWNGYYLVLAHPFFALSVLTTGVFVLRRTGISQLHTWLAAAFFVLFLVTFNRFVMHTFYVNSHMLFALCVMAIAGAGWLMARPDAKDVPALVLLQALAAITLILTRMEGAIVAVIALAPTLLNGNISAHVRVGLLAVTGTAIIGWNGFVLGVYEARGVNIFAFLESGARVRARNASSSVVYFALGLAAIAAAPLLYLKLFSRRPLIWLGLLEGLLLALLVVLIWRDPSNLLTTADVTLRNLNWFWGPSWGLLVFAFVMALALVRIPHSAYLRMPVTAFALVWILLAYMRGSPYRYGGGDSGNRMMFHAVPLMVLLIAAALADGEVRARVRNAAGWAFKQLGSFTGKAPGKAG